MNITRLNEQDKKYVLNLFKEVTKELRNKGINQWDRFYPNRFVIGSDLKKQHLHGVKVGDRVIAAVTINRSNSRKYQTIQWDGEAETAGCIHRLAVHPQYQGNGLGKQLLLFAENLAQEQGFTSIRLDVFSNNPSAVTLYRHNGYQEKGEISFPFRKEPYLCLEKILV